jgi:hypothetical protein
VFESFFFPILACSDSFHFNHKMSKLFSLAFQYLSTAEFTMREELSLKAAILAEKFAPDLSW